MKNYWRKIKEENAYNGFRKIIRRHFLSPDGRQAEFDIKAENDTVSVLALTGDHKIILAEQFRHGPETICLELPGGSIDGKVNSKVAAQRELLEETGYAGEIVFVGTSLHDAYSTMTCYHFVVLR